VRHLLNELISLLNLVGITGVRITGVGVAVRTRYNLDVGIKLSSHVGSLLVAIGISNSR